MVATPFTRATSGVVLAAVTGGENRVTSFMGLVAVNFPTASLRTSEAPALVAAKGIEAIRTSGMTALAAVKGIEAVRTSNAAVLVAARGRIQNPRVRAWTFTLDGHDFYVLRLGNSKTLVYDVYSEQWMDWDAFNEVYWPVNIGINWSGGVGLVDPDGDPWGSNVVVGDDTLGLLWFLNPEQQWDESYDGPLDPEQSRFFERVTMGQVAIRGRENLPCYAVWLTTDMGSPAYIGAGVKLEISDDAGHTFDDMGTVTVELDAQAPQLSWESLGQIEAPGRLFRITDDGAVFRIDGMEMNDPDDE
jgi:hypothetical protein